MKKILEFLKDYFLVETKLNKEFNFNDSELKQKIEFMQTQEEIKKEEKIKMINYLNNTSLEESNEFLENQDNLSQQEQIDLEDDLNNISQEELIKLRDELSNMLKDVNEILKERFNLDNFALASKQANATAAEQNYIIEHLNSQISDSSYNLLDLNNFINIFKELIFSLNFALAWQQPSAATEQSIVVIHIFGALTILFLIFSILTILYINFLIEYFDINNKYPKLKKIIDYKLKFSRYFIIFNITLILSVILVELFIDLNYLGII